MLAVRSVEVAKRDAPGCLINFPDDKPELHSSISYREAIPPRQRFEQSFEQFDRDGDGGRSISEYVDANRRGPGGSPPAL